MAKAIVEISPENKAQWVRALEMASIQEAKQSAYTKLVDKLNNHDLRIMSGGKQVAYRRPFDGDWVDL